MGAGIGTLYGALLGAAGAGTYLYLEFVARVFVWAVKSIMHHPIAALVGVFVFIGVSSRLLPLEKKVQTNLLEAKSLENQLQFKSNDN
jgi:hypothetical protein